MRFIKRYTRSAAISFLIAVMASTSMIKNVIAEENEELTVAFPDTWMIRLGAYIIDGANTTVSVGSDVALGAIIDYQKDLGGEDGDTIPRIDAYYRFNERHRIDFTSFSIDRKGTRTLDATITIGDETYNANETINSDIKYTLYRVGYGYSFYHSPKTELTLTAGLNITEYDLKFSLVSGGQAESAGVTVPLPVVGLRMGYAITPKWYVRYVSEAFFIDIDDKFRGAIINFELNTEYRLFKHFALGAGLARIGVNAEVNDDDWKGKVTDSYRGFNVFGTFYF
ncbi:MAG: hypothetical protein KJP10_08950 [Gammaproteobacteria bacterium]|nr:hypothetical protein [Gammaproteobacteria bacterium]